MILETEIGCEPSDMAPISLLSHQKGEVPQKGEGEGCYCHSSGDEGDDDNDNDSDDKDNINRCHPPGPQDAPGTIS